MTGSATADQKLGDLFQFKNGRAFKKTEWSTEGLPIIRIQNLNDPTAQFNYFSGEYSKEILIGSGDLLFSWSGTVGTSFGSHIWNGDVGLLNQHIFKVTHGEDIDRRYAFYALRHITSDIEEAVGGAVGLVHITKEKLLDFTIPVPSLAEQKRIVAVLDQACEAIDAAKQNYGSNLRNKNELFDSYLTDLLRRREKGWRDEALSKICVVERGSSPRPIKKYFTTHSSG